MAKIAIVGAGLLGRLLSLLLDKQHNVSLFEQKSLNESTTTGRLAAAMVAPTAESVIATDNIVRMGQHSTKLWPQLLSQLGLDDLYQHQGTLVVAHRQDAADLSHFQQRLSGLTEDKVKPVQQADIEQLEPELATQFYHGLFLADEGQVMNHRLYDATEQQILNSNIELFEHCVVELDGDCLVVNGETLDFDLVIDCRGLGSKGELQDQQATLRGVRGEVAWLHAPEVNLSRPIRLMHPRYPLYIAPKESHVFVVGATEIESQDDKNITVRSALELLSAAYSIHSGFAEAEIIQLSSGLRPTLLDNEPEISVSDKLVQVNGLYRHGYLLTPYMLNQTVLQLNNMGMSVDTFSSDLNEIDASLVKEIKV